MAMEDGELIETDITGLIDPNSGFWRFNGSLTTPPCSEAGVLIGAYKKSHDMPATLERGPGRKPGACLYTRTRLSLPCQLTLRAYVGVSGSIPALNTSI